MDLLSVKTIKNLLAEGARGASSRSAGTPRSGARKRQAVGARPRKGLGQNFLTSKGVLGDILKAANLKKSDTVFEVGPGIGTLTRELARCAKRVIAVEKDSAMVNILRETTKDLHNIEIIQGDILKQNLVGLSYPQLSPTKYKVVANLPYYITSPVIRLFLEAENKPDLMVFMVQKEVAQRICAKPRTRTSSVRGRPPMNLLAVSVQFYATPSIVSYVKKSCFWPQPKVDSAILRINTSISHGREILMSPEKQKLFFRIVKAGFKQPRKQLANNLSHALPGMLDARRLTRSEQKEQVEIWLNENNINPKQRAETLSVEDWINLSQDYTMEK